METMLACFQSAIQVNRHNGHEEVRFYKRLKYGEVNLGSPSINEQPITFANGLSYDADTGEPVSLPIPKIFPGVEPLFGASIASVSEKIDGHLVCVRRTRLNNKGWAVETKGSFESPTAVLAEKIIDQLESELRKRILEIVMDLKVALAFEMVYPETKNIINYGTNDFGFYLIAAHRIDSGRITYWSDSCLDNLAKLINGSDGISIFRRPWHSSIRLLFPPNVLGHVEPLPHESQVSFCSYINMLVETMELHDLECGRIEHEGIVVRAHLDGPRWCKLKPRSFELARKR